VPKSISLGKRILAETLLPLFELTIIWRELPVPVWFMEAL